MPIREQKPKAQISEIITRPDYKILLLDLRSIRRKFDINTKYYSDEIHSQAFMPPKMYEKLMRKGLEW